MYVEISMPNFDVRLYYLHLVFREETNDSYGRVPPVRFSHSSARLENDIDMPSNFMPVILTKGQPQPQRPTW